MGRRSTKRTATRDTRVAPPLTQINTHSGEAAPLAGASDSPGNIAVLEDVPEVEPRFEFVPDELGGMTVIVDGFPQSYVHTADPGLLPFEYMQHFAAVVDVLPIGKVTVTHVGGAGLTLPRYVEFTRPGSPQVVFEPDGRLTEAVRSTMPLPRGHRIRVREQTGQEGIRALADDSADLVVIDAFADGRVPAELTDPAFLRECARVAAPTGMVAFNVPDAPGLAFVNRVVATAREAGLPHALLIATHEVLRGKRFGNVVMACSATPVPEQEIRQRVARAAFPTGLRDQHETRKHTAAAPPIREGEHVVSPQPPVPGVWRAV